MDRNVHADLPFSEDAFIDADITGAINVDIREVLYNTTEYWDSHPEIRTAKGIIYIYSDYKIIDDKTIPGIKVGDGSSYLIDIPFTDIEVDLKADKATTYTKTEVNTALSLKADKANTYTKTEVNTALNDKADKSTTYTKTEVNTALSSKADKSTTYTKTEVDAALDLKADTEDVTASLALKADKANTYTKTEVDTALTTKADKADTYTKTQVDNALSAKANTADVTASLALKADKADTYTKEQVDNIISNLPEPMIFKGTLGVNGTISDLPVASSDNDGYTYKVITDGTYQGIAAKVGDVFTSNGVEWVLIPSGDDVEDTWRTIKVNGTEVLNSAISSGSVDFVEGDNIEIIFNSTGHTILFKTKNIYTKAEVDTALNDKADKNTTYTKSEVDTALAGKSNVAVAPIVTSGVDIATVTVDGTPTTIKAPAQVSEIDDTVIASNKTFSSEKISEELENKADTDGTYEDMTVGTAMKLVATRHTTDTAPYLFRQSGGDNNAYVGTEETDKLVGASAVVNQLVKNGNFVNTSNWLAINSSLSVANNEATVTVTDTSLASEIRTVVPNRKGHKYFRSAEVKASQGQFIFSWYGGIAITRNANGNYQTISDIFESPSNDSDNWRLQLGVKADNSPSEFFVKNVILIDLTAMFGTAIADYVYSLEQATAGSGIAYLRKYGFFTKSYYPYQANALQSVKTSAHVMMSANRWDEETELGSWNDNSQKWVASTTQLKSKNYIAILPSIKYRFVCPSGSASRIVYYDKEQNYLSWSSATSNALFTTPNNAYYIMFGLSTYYGTTYNNNVSINYPTHTTYYPYVKHEYALPNIDLRGLYKLDASNNLYADGDVLTSDGTLTRKYGVLDLGTQTWKAHTYGGVQGFYATTILPKLNARGICTSYTWASGDYVFNTNGKDKEIYISDVLIKIKDSAYSNADDFKAAMNGVLLIFELKNTTTEQVTGFTNPQVVSQYGTEEYTDERDFPLPVGHETDYPLESEMALPVPPITAGTYNLQLTVDASGNQTYSWVT